MRREAMYLGQPRQVYPLQVKIQVQSIGSGIKHTMAIESLLGWELTVAMSPDQRPGFNPMSILEVWIEDAETQRNIFGFAKYVQALNTGGMILRIIEIDHQNEDYLEEMISRGQTYIQQDAV